MWMLGNITSIHKKVEKNIPTNFRPISLLSVVGKVMERIIYDKTYNFLIDNKVLSQLLAAYQPRSSMTCQILELYDQLQEAMVEGKEILFVFCDISKAFDRVWHAGILHKLWEAGITGSLLRWFTNYLSDRRQRVIINGQSSTVISIMVGELPTGSILGPLLFILYMNDIVTQVDINIHVGLYADDVPLFVSHTNHEEASLYI